MRQAGLGVLFTILAASTQREKCLASSHEALGLLPRRLEFEAGTSACTCLRTVLTNHGQSPKDSL